MNVVKESTCSGPGAKGGGGGGGGGVDIYDLGIFWGRKILASIFWLDPLYQ